MLFANYVIKIRLAKTKKLVYILCYVMIVKYINKKLFVVFALKINNKKTIKNNIKITNYLRIFLKAVNNLKVFIHKVIVINH